jgi:hypothetical protein
LLEILNFIIANKYCLTFLKTVSHLCSPSWPWSHDPSVPTPWVHRLQVCTTVSSCLICNNRVTSFNFLILILFRLNCRLHAVIRSNTDRTHVPFTNISLRETSCKTVHSAVAQSGWWHWHSQVTEQSPLIYPLTAIYMFSISILLSCTNVLLIQSCSLESFVIDFPSPTHPLHNSL